MKLTIQSSDSIHKIFTLLKKIPAGKQVDIFLDDHPLLSEERWMDVWIEELQKLSLIVHITTKNRNIAEYLANKWILTTYTPKKSRETTISHILHRFWFKKKAGHSLREYIKSKLSLLAELLVLFGIIYIFRGTISPKATITIIPAIWVQPITYGFLYHPHGLDPEQTTTEALEVSRYTWQASYRVSKIINLVSVNTTLVPAKWVVTLYNTTPEPVSLLDKTTLITEEGIIFTLDYRVEIPAGSPENPGVKNVDVTAKDYFPNGETIGELWNIPKESKLWIEKLSTSKEEKKIRWINKKAFENGKTIILGIAVSSDIQRLEELLYTEVKQQQSVIIRNALDADREIALPIEDEIDIHIDRFITNAKPGEQVSFLQWTLEATITYPYVKKAELEKQAYTYLQQRSSSATKLHTISLDSVNMYEPRAFSRQERSYVIPTTFQRLISYDFSNDTYDILRTLPGKIVGMDEDTAKQTLLQVEYIQEVHIRFSPPWYHTLPLSTEKISIQIAKEALK